MSIMDDHSSFPIGASASPKIDLPEKRTFVVKGLEGETSVVEAHQFMIEDSGVLSFVEYTFLEVGQSPPVLVPQKTEAFAAWFRVSEQKAFVGASLTAN
jgi:hypothetical protein